MKKGLSIIVVFVLSLNTSCKKEQLQQNNGMFSKDGTKISDSMMAVVKSHMKEAKKTADSIVQNRPQIIKTSCFPPTATTPTQTKKFVFVVLNVSEPTEIGADYKKYSQRQLVSGISEINDYNEDAKAMLEDQIIQSYSMGAFSGDVISKETFAFDTYASASKKRNTFLIENP